MLVRSILLGGVAALGASAMLVVPEMEPLLEPVENGLMEPMLGEEFRHVVVGLSCAECPFREVDQDGAVRWVDGKSPHVILDFSIEENYLLANGRQVFPPVPGKSTHAVQELDDGQVSEPMPIGYALEVMPLGSPDDDPGIELLVVRFTVLDLETIPVPVDTVAITLIQDLAGELYIMKTEVEETASPSQHMSWKKCNGKPKCLQEFLMARIRGLLAAAKERVLRIAGKVSRKGCHGKHQGLKGMGGHHQQHDSDKLGAAMSDRPHPPHDHKGHHHHHPHSAFARTLSRVFRFIIVPAVLGVLAGLTASAVGMLVGQAVIFLWQRYRGTKSQDHTAAWEQGEACEKQGLMVETSETSDEVLPEYTGPASPRASMDKH